MLQLGEQLLMDPAHQFGCATDHDGVLRTRDRRQHGGIIEQDRRPHLHDLHVHAALAPRFGHCEAVSDRRTPGHDGGVAPRAPDRHHLPSLPRRPVGTDTSAPIVARTMSVRAGSGGSPRPGAGRAILGLLAAIVLAACSATADVRATTTPPNPTTTVPPSATGVTAPSTTTP